MSLMGGGGKTRVFLGEGDFLCQQNIPIKLIKTPYGFAGPLKLHDVLFVKSAMSAVSRLKG